MTSLFQSLSERYQSVATQDSPDNTDESSNATRASLLGDKNPFAALMGNQDPSAVEEEFELCPSLTYQQRVLGFLACMCLGYLIGFGGVFRFKELILGNPRPFVVMYTVGNLIALSGSFFLSGPNTQMSKMFHESRRVSSITYLSTLFITLIVAFMPSFTGKALVLFTLCIVETLSLTWYCLSYVPYGRTYVKKALTSLMNS